MESPGTTLLRKTQQFLISLMEMTHCHDPLLVEAVEWMSHRLPPEISLEQMMRNAVSLHKLVDPTIIHARKVRRLPEGDVQLNLTGLEYVEVVRGLGSLMNEAMAKRENARVAEVAKLIETVNPAFSASNPTSRAGARL